MIHKNPDNKPLRIRQTGVVPSGKYYGLMLSNLAVAQSNLVKAGKDSAMPHFIAVVKELERYYGFKFEIMDE